MKKAIIFIIFFGFFLAAWSRGDGIHQAAARGDLAKIKELIQANGKLIGSRDSNGRTPLSVAAWHGRVELIKFLAARGADTNARDRNGLTPLFSALDRGKTRVAGILINLGADIKVRGYRNRTLLHMAARSGNLTVARLLITKGAEINARDSRGSTPLQCIHPGTQKEMVRFLVDNGADVNVTDENGISLIKHLIAEGDAPIALLLIKNGLNTTRKDPYFGRTPLHWAAIKGREQAARALLEVKADVNARDSNGHTPLFLARRYGHAELARLIKTGGGTLGGKTLPATVGTLLGKGLKTGEGVLFYLGHCGWAIKTASHFLVFDYYELGEKPRQPSLANGHINIKEIKDLKVRIFVTHGHTDHFDPVIFGWQKRVRDIKYIYGFNPDFYATSRGRRRKKVAYNGPPYIMVGPRQGKNLAGLQIDTIKSNDAGVGFLVKVDGLSIYHAGDHAGWRQLEKAGYTREIDYIAGMATKLDFAFINVTGCHARCETALEAGTQYTLEKLTPRIWFPTHAGENEHIYQQFARKAGNKKIATTVVCPQNRGNIYIYKGGSIQAH
jgi:ankyrin repeat protein/L-ascorbate metabolism protein UlaG (beta-lactamase superfamily)